MKVKMIIQQQMKNKRYNLLALMTGSLCENYPLSWRNILISTEQLGFSLDAHWNYACCIHK